MSEKIESQTNQTFSPASAEKQKTSDLNHNGQKGLQPPAFQISNEKTSGDSQLLQAKFDASPIQTKSMEEEEELLQAKFDASPIQTKSMEEEEEMLQAKFNASPIQTKSTEEEEEMLQAKFNASPIQTKSTEEEEELLQAKFHATPIQTKSAEEEEEMIQAKFDASPIQTKEQKNNDSGDVMSKMESAFGTSFADVKIHENSREATDLGALAYTQGNDVHFAPGQFRPNTTAGQELIGHELAHVVQQRQGRVEPTMEVKGKSINNSRSLEAEADQMGTKAAAAKTVVLRNNLPSQALTSATAQLKTIHDVPEDTKRRERNPLAIRGDGDAHAFSPNDINQGAIGDCYFLASLAAVAHTNPSLLQKAIRDNGDGTFDVTLYSYEDEEKCYSTLRPRTVTIEATFPKEAAGHDDANSDTSSLPGHATGGDRNQNRIGFFTIPGGPEIWVRLIEKAFAVINGGYSNIAKGGKTTDALKALTGEEYSYAGSAGSQPQDIMDKLSSGEALASPTKSQADFDALSDELSTFADEHDIVAGHAYAILSATEDSITVRNPWGEGTDTPVVTMTWAQWRAFFHGYSSPS